MIADFWKVIDFFQTYNGAITALATVAIGVFTFVLVIVTRRQAILTKQSVNISERALVDLERAYIFIEGVGGELDPFISMVDVAGVPRFIVPDFSVSLINYGRTAGNIDIGTARVEILKSMPPEINIAELTAGNRRVRNAEIIIGPGGSFTVSPLSFETPFQQEQGVAIRDGTMSIYCHGFFEYRDIFNNSHTIKFCRRYFVPTKEWIPEGGRERNQYT